MVMRRRGAERLSTPPRQFRAALLTNSVLVAFFGVTERVSPTTFLIKRMKKNAPPPGPREDPELAAKTDVVIECYILLVTAALLGGLFLAWCAPTWSWGRIPVYVFLVALVGLRWLEIVTATLELILGRLTMRYLSVLAVIVVYVTQTVLIFSILALLCASGFTTAGGHHPETPFDAVYLTWNTMGTLGNAYDADSVLARIIEMFTGLTTIALFSVILAYAVGRIGLDTPPAEPATPALADELPTKHPTVWESLVLLMPRCPVMTVRADPDLHERAKAAVALVDSNLNAHVVAFLRWLAHDTDDLPPRPPADTKT
ncbi:hypothetical protein ACFXPS_29820 [Nocardia sp. NPDC059091]|uniref:hypothetical protein n=1 Tax=unclassified Nocardia TaxID=2637762 RepID=UPI0036AA7578